MEWSRWLPLPARITLPRGALAGYGPANRWLAAQGFEHLNSDHARNPSRSGRFALVGRELAQSAPVVLDTKFRDTPAIPDNHTLSPAPGQRFGVAQSMIREYRRILGRRVKPIQLIPVNESNNTVLLL